MFVLVLSPVLAAFVTFFFFVVVDTPHCPLQAVNRVYQSREPAGAENL